MDLNYDCIFIILNWIRIGERFKYMLVSNEWKEIIQLTFRCSKKIQLTGKNPDFHLTWYTDSFKVNEPIRLYIESLEHYNISQIVLNFANLREISLAFLYIDDEEIKQLIMSYPQLRKIQLKQTSGINDVNSIINNFSKELGKLENVDISLNFKSERIPLKEASLFQLVNSCDYLEALLVYSNILSKNKISGLSLVSSKQQFKKLDLTPCPDIKYETLKQILNNKGTSLEQLTIDINSNINGSILKYVNLYCDKLKAFSFTIYSIGLINSDDLSELKNLKYLKSLTINSMFSSNLLTDSLMLSIIRSCTHIQNLLLYGFPFSEEVMLNISNDSIEKLSMFLPNIRKLVIDSAKKIDDGCCKYLARLTNLDYLALRDTNIGDEISIVLKTYPKLYLLEVSDSNKVTDKLVSSAFLRANTFKQSSLALFLVRCKHVNYFKFLIEPPSNLIIYDTYYN